MLRAMDAVRAGRAFRALRMHLGLRQRDVATRAGVSQQHVSDLERGQLGAMSIDAVGSLYAALGATVSLAVVWRGGQLDRLLDEGHAAMAAAVATSLRGLSWEVFPEVTFSVYGERGSIDLLGWHPATRTLLVIEVKTEIASAEELLRRHDTKVRLAAGLGRERFGQAPLVVSRLLVVAGTDANRRRVTRLGPILDAAYALRGTALRRWLRAPAGPIGGLLYASTARGGGIHRRHQPSRVRVGGGTVRGGG